MDNIGVRSTLYNKSIKMIHWNHSERNYASIEMGRKTMKERNRQISRRMDTHGIIVVERFATFHYY